MQLTCARLPITLLEVILYHTIQLSKTKNFFRLLAETSTLGSYSRTLKFKRLETLNQLFKAAATKPRLYSPSRSCQQGNLFSLIFLLVEVRGLEPLTSGLQSPRSAN
jgi:hypothetical protein